VTSTIQVYSGGLIDPLRPNPSDIHIEDLAHALSNICRFTGHTSSFYSVAEHAVRVSAICPPKDQFWGLNHDDSEAYLCDFARPIKHHPRMAIYREAEERLMRVIAKRLSLEMPIPESVKRADTILLMTECRDLMKPLQWEWNNGLQPLQERIVPWPPQKAKEAFLARFYELAAAQLRNERRSEQRYADRRRKTKSQTTGA